MNSKQQNLLMKILIHLCSLGLIVRIFIVYFSGARPSLGYLADLPVVGLLGGLAILMGVRWWVYLREPVEIVCESKIQLGRVLGELVDFLYRGFFYLLSTAPNQKVIDVCTSASMSEGGITVVRARDQVFLMLLQIKGFLPLNILIFPLSLLTLVLARQPNYSRMLNGIPGAEPVFVMIACSLAVYSVVTAVFAAFLRKG